MNLFYQPNISAGHLDPEESRHATKVLRLKSGDRINITDGKGVLYEAQVTQPDFSKCGFRITTSVPSPPKSYHIHIAIAPTKNTDRIEWFVEKATELGIDRITFLLCDNSERKVLKLDRLEKLTISAMKQSGQVRLPELAPLCPFAEILKEKSDQKFIAFVDNLNPKHLKSVATPGAKVLVLIGPEGDFSSAELQSALDNGFRKVSLGPTRLRTETAGIAACHIVNLINS